MVSSQLSSPDFLMIGIRASSRVSAQKPQAEKSSSVLSTWSTHSRRHEIVMEVEMTLSVMHKAVTELNDETTGRAVVSSMQNAIGRLQV